MRSNLMDGYTVGIYDSNGRLGGDGGLVEATTIGQTGAT